MKIYKYPMIAEPLQPFEVQVPVGSYLLDVQEQNGQLVAWMAASDSKFRGVIEFIWVWTGQEIPEGYYYLLTVQHENLVLHLFRK
jgi:hypothetical protein